VNQNRMVTWKAKSWKEMFSQRNVATIIREEKWLGIAMFRKIQLLKIRRWGYNDKGKVYIKLMKKKIIMSVAPLNVLYLLSCSFFILCLLNG